MGSEGIEDFRWASIDVLQPWSANHHKCVSCTSSLSLDSNTFVKRLFQLPHMEFNSRGLIKQVHIHAILWALRCYEYRSWLQRRNKPGQALIQCFSGGGWSMWGKVHAGASDKMVELGCVKFFVLFWLVFTDSGVQAIYTAPQCSCSSGCLTCGSRHVSNFRWISSVCKQVWSKSYVWAAGAPAEDRFENLS